VIDGVATSNQSVAISNQIVSAVISCAAGLIAVPLAAVASCFGWKPGPIDVVADDAAAQSANVGIRKRHLYLVGATTTIETPPGVGTHVRWAARLS